jgi:FkbM family methyltransferase
MQIALSGGLSLMSIGRGSAAKRLVQSSIRACSQLLATPATEVLLSGAAAYMNAICGLGWSPSLELEAKSAVVWIARGSDYTVIDAGANIGDWTSLFHKHAADRTGTIYALEPQPAAAARIRALNLKCCEVVELALGEHPGRATFHTSGPLDTTGSLFDRNDTYGRGRTYGSFEVEVVRIDDFVRMRGIERIDFMKMDLEGGEHQALKGAAECLRSRRIRALSFEFGTSNVNARVFFREIYDLLAGNGFAIFRVTPAGRLIPVSAYAEDYECFARTTTYFARIEAA